MRKTRAIALLIAAILLDGIVEIALLAAVWPLVFILALLGLGAAAVTFTVLYRKVKRDRLSLLSVLLDSEETMLQYLLLFVAGFCFLLPGPVTALLGILLLWPAARAWLLGRAEPKSTSGASDEDYIPASQMTLDVKPLRVRDAEP